MPYGFAKKAGGDSPANDAKMKMCIQAVMAKGSDKVTAIRICKAKLQKSAMKKKTEPAESEPSSGPPWAKEK